MNKSAWYKDWFDSIYYHILYKNRDVAEAQQFIKNLIEYFRPMPKSNMLDLACGIGRHARTLAAHGHHVTGVDLSERNILEAKKYENSHLQFDVHDMRLPYMRNTFDYVFNLFTSFGYFEDESDNLKVIRAVYDSLKPNGLFVIDFMNVEYAIQQMVEYEEKVIDDIPFTIHRSAKNGYIYKNISFTTDGQFFQFEERVQQIRMDDFKRYFADVNMEITDVFGNYELLPFDKSHSPRLILAVKKTSI